MEIKKEEELFVCDGVGEHCWYEGHLPPEYCKGYYPHNHIDAGCNEQRHCRKAGKFTKCIPYFQLKIELPKNLFEL